MLKSGYKTCPPLLGRGGGVGGGKVFGPFISPFCSTPLPMIMTGHLRNLTGLSLIKASICMLYQTSTMLKKQGNSDNSVKLA